MDVDHSFLDALSMINDVDIAILENTHEYCGVVPIFCSVCLNLKNIVQVGKRRLRIL
jgi:hypothetical protein